MTINTESNTAVTGQVHATEKPLASSKNLSQKLTGQKLPSVDLTQPVARYLAPLQKGVDLNRHLATQGAGLFASLLRHVRGQARWVRSIVNEQTDPATDLSNEQAEREQAEREQAEREQAEREQAERESAKRKLKAAKRTLETAKLKRETAERTLEAARLRREQAEREQTERETAEREQTERETAEREQTERETAEREQTERETAEREQA